MRALNRKLLRDLWQIKGQGIAISLVIGVGITMYVTYLSNFDSLRLTQAAYYERQHFGAVFARANRAPLRLESRIAAIPGVSRVETRVVADVTLDVRGMDEPASGRLISIPDNRRPTVNDIYLRDGSYIEPERPDEVIASAAFADAHGFKAGDTVTAVINGRRRELTIVGTALSPEYVYTIRPGEMVPDDLHFGVFWMEGRALATAFDMEGAFNDVSLELLPGADEEEVIARLDQLLKPYGGLGAIPRALQISHWVLDTELKGLQTFGWIMPMIFLAVAAFLLNVVLTRIVTVQREQIAALKALGYSNREVGLHYTGWALVISLVGSGIGIAAGAWLGSALTQLYNQFYRFPVLTYILSPSLVVGALAVSLTAAVAGAAFAVRRAVRLPPAEAMRPEPPARYRVSLIERTGLRRFFSQPMRMIFRNLQRQPARSAISLIGVSCAGAMLVAGLFFIDSMDVLIDAQFNVSQRQDATVTFNLPRSAAALHEAANLPGVIYAEPMRTVPVRLRYCHRSRQLAVVGLERIPELQRVIDASFTAYELPEEGLVLSAKLGEVMGIERGDLVTLEVLEGERPVRNVPVVDLVDDFMGLSAYMEIGALRRLMREGGTLSGAYLLVDHSLMDAFYRRVKAIPAVAGVGLTWAALQGFRDTMAQSLNIIIFFNVLFAGIIAFGVVYNAARVSLSERSRELASLRVIGFTRAEISFILLGELAVVTVVAIPLGMLLGYGLAALVVAAYDIELYRFPLVVTPRTYAISAVTVVVASLLSGLVVRRKLDRLDLVAVLKTRE